MLSVLLPVTSVFEHMVGSASIELVSFRKIYPALLQPGDAGYSMLVVKNARERARTGLQGALGAVVSIDYKS